MFGHPEAIYGNMLQDVKWRWTLQDIACVNWPASSKIWQHDPTMLQDVVVKVPEMLHAFDQA